MATVIKLDAPAVRELITDNPEMRLELGRAVVSEIVRNTCERDVRAMIKDASQSDIDSVSKRVVEKMYVDTLVENIVSDVRKAIRGLDARKKGKLLNATEKQELEKKFKVVALSAMNVQIERAAATHKKNIEAKIEGAAKAASASVEERMTEIVADDMYGMSEKLMAQEIKKRLNGVINKLNEGDL